MSDIILPKFNVTIPEGSQSYRIEMALRSITEQMNAHPLRVNKATWMKNVQAKRIVVDQLTEECRQATGERGFRPNARKDCMDYFFGRMGYKPSRRTPAGEPTMDKDALTVFANQGDPVANKVIEAREAKSELSQLEAWEPYASAGEVQTNWDSLGQPMGRYTSDSPNLQNRILEIRETIEARDGFTLISCDLGAAEYVGWASLSKDRTLSAIFESGQDVHTEMINLILNLVPDLDLRGEPPRQFGKMINHAICYRMQVWTLAGKLGCSVETAQKVMDAYKLKAPSAVIYQDNLLNMVRQTGWVTTYYGRTREMIGIKSARGGMLHEMEKTAWHHHNCGSAAEVLKIKQARLAAALAQAGMYPSRARVAINHYDELILEVQNDVVEPVKEIMLEVFHRPIANFLPFKVDCRMGTNWLQTSK